MFGRTTAAVLALTSLGACALFHLGGGSACQRAINYKGHRITVGAAKVPIAVDGQVVRVAQIAVASDKVTEESGIVQQFDELQFSTCQAMERVERKDRPPYAQIRTQLLADFSFVVQSLSHAKTMVEYNAALLDARARVRTDGRAAAQLPAP